jgi:hypothetical protein
MCAVCEMRAVYQYEFKYKYVCVLLPVLVLVAAAWVFFLNYPGMRRMSKWGLQNYSPYFPAG